MAQAADRGSVFERMMASVEVTLANFDAHEEMRAKSPIPTPKPERMTVTAPPKPVTPPAAKPETPPAGAVAQCGYATIVSKLGRDGKTPIYRATFAPDMADDMVGQGCAQFTQGCNVCSVRYLGCDEAERKACKDAACLEKTCERKVMCSAKTCTVKGKAPTCESRIARNSCLKTHFE